MIKTAWKSSDEIRYSLRNARKVAIISCGWCCKLCGTGGVIGIGILKSLLDEWGKKVVVARCLLAPCVEHIMAQSLRKNRESISKSDALVMISCSAGVKLAYVCNPLVPVVAALDTLGTEPISRQEDPVILSTCTECEHCVIMYTAGICPVNECLAKSLYGPCSKAPKDGTQCALDPQQDCIWKEIAKRGGDLATLKELEKIHKAKDTIRLSTPPGRDGTAFSRKSTGWVVARMPWLEKLIPYML